MRRAPAAKSRVDSADKPVKKPSRMIDKVSDLEPGETTVGIMAKNLSTEQVCKMLFDTSKAKTVDDGSASAKKTGSFSSSTIDPYLDKPRGDEVIDLSNTIVLDKIVFLKYRFDENYIFAIEKVELDTNEFNISNYLAWSVKRCRYGENDEDYVPDRQGKLKKRFAFSGKISTLPELHEAVMNLCNTSQTETMIPWEKAKNLEADKFGCVDISAACKPIYCNKVYAFGGYRAYMDDVTYTSGTQHAITYKTLVLTKWRNDKAKGGKSKTQEKYFVLHIPARRMRHFLLAIELAMFVNDIKPKSSFHFAKKELADAAASDDSDYTPSEDEAGGEESDVEENRGKKRKRCATEDESDDEQQQQQRRRRKLRKVAATPSYVEYSDSDDDDEAVNTRADDEVSDAVDDDGEDDDPTPTVQEEEAEADDKPSQSDEDFIDDQPEAPAKNGKRKRSPPAQDESESESEAKKPKVTDAMLAQMYRRMMTAKKTGK